MAVTWHCTWLGWRRAREPIAPANGGRHSVHQRVEENTTKLVRTLAAADCEGLASGEVIGHGAFGSTAAAMLRRGRGAHEVERDVAKVMA